MNKFFLPSILAGSLVAASMLNVYPLSPIFAPYRPMILVLVLIFWLIYEPNWVGVGSAFLVGLLADLLFDAHLGHQALALSLVAFLLRFAQRYAKRVSFEATWLLTAAALVLYRLLWWFFQSFGDASVAFGGWSLVVSVLSYPLVWAVLIAARTRAGRRRFA